MFPLKRVQSLLRQRCAQRSLCPVLHPGPDLRTLEAAICANMQVLTLHIFLRTLFIFFNYVVIQRKRLICISVRADSVKMAWSNWVTCLLARFVFFSFYLYKDSGILAQAGAPVAPTNCPETRNMGSEAWQRLPQPAAHKPGCAAQGFPCPRQKLPSPRAFRSQLVASCGSTVFLGYDCCFPKIYDSWLNLFLIL